MARTKNEKKAVKRSWCLHLPGEQNLQSLKVPQMSVNCDPSPSDTVLVMGQLGTYQVPHYGGQNHSFWNESKEIFSAHALPT